MWKSGKMLFHPLYFMNKIYQNKLKTKTFENNFCYGITIGSSYTHTQADERNPRRFLCTTNRDLVVVLKLPHRQIKGGSPFSDLKNILSSLQLKLLALVSSMFTGRSPT